MAVLAPEKPVSRAKLSVGLVLLTGLLILRLPLLAGLGTFMHPVPAWLYPAFMIGTYVLNAALIFWERDRLEQFHIDGWALGIYILVPLLLAPATFSQSLTNLALYNVVCVAVLALALLLTRTRLPKARLATLLWFAVAVLVGTAAGAAYGYIGRWQGETAGPLHASFLLWGGLFLNQLTTAAFLEEPLFRGFLWGYLRMAGWKDVWIWLLQAVLFALGHSYYFGRANISFWVIVPTASLILGWIAWRSRSIGASMTVHGFLNSVTDLVSHTRW